MSQAFLYAAVMKMMGIADTGVLNPYPSQASESEQLPKI